MKFWPRLFLARELEASASTSPSGGRPSGLAAAPSRLMGVREPARLGTAAPELGGELQRGDEAARAGLAGAGQREGGAVIGRGAHERQAERDVDAAVEGQRLERDQRLVVVHGDGGVVGAARLGVEQGVGGMRTGHGQTLGGKLGHGGSDHVHLLAADQAAFAGVRIEPRHGDARPGDAEVAR